MKHAVIIAHPDPDSLTCAVGKAYAEAALAQGHKVEVRDLYRMGFDPRLQASEIPRPSGHRMGSDVLAEREKLGDCDVFVLVYPLWFNAPPAMMKGYIDRVFGMGFGFGPGMGGSEPLLEGKKLISLTLSGAPEQWVRETGALGALEALFDRHVCAMCGLQMLEHLHFGEIGPAMPPESVAEVLGKTTALVERQFSDKTG